MKREEHHKEVSPHLLHRGDAQIVLMNEGIKTITVVNVPAKIARPTSDVPLSAANLGFVPASRRLNEIASETTTLLSTNRPIVSIKPTSDKIFRVVPEKYIKPRVAQRERYRHSN